MDQKSPPPVFVRILHNEHGFILILALLMLVAITLTSTAAMLLRNTEQYVVANTEVRQHNFYAAEAVTLEGIVAIKKADSSVLIDPEDETYGWLAAINPDDNDNWPPVDLGDTSEWYRANSHVKPADTELDTSDSNILPAGYDSTGSASGDRIWYAVMRGTMNSDHNQRDNCGGGSLSDPDKVEKCFTVYGMYDVKSGKGKTYSGQKLLMLGYRYMVFVN